MKRSLKPSAPALKRLAALLLPALLLGACVAGPSGNADVPEPAKPVDLQSYMGLWYEQARYETSFEEGCEGVTAEYALKPGAEEVSVTNTCREGSPGGMVKVSEGRAVPAGDPMGAKFKVTFFGPALFTNYWVLDHGENYEWSIVGEGSGRFLWILTRDATISPATYESLTARAAELGYDISMLRRTQQPPGPPPPAQEN